MTAFLFIPTGASSLGRRVDFANIGSLFAEIEEPPRRRRRRPVARLGLLILLLLGTIGDTVLVARPDALAAALGTAPGAPAAAGF